MIVLVAGVRLALVLSAFTGWSWVRFIRRVFGEEFDRYSSESVALGTLEPLE